ncbi:class I SAM-dependent methyltransferase [Isoptericola sediminis]|uniref:Methyltransferase n=1 Tax=Isoptericola sediminis TaxID=2733572 RepID=A0A849K3N8_9MICO|nr:methyltransferase [Isoptericola sediminis]
MFTEAEAQDDRRVAWAFSESFLTEDATLRRARERAFGLGCPTISPGTGALLRVVAAATQARTAVEIGSDAGVTALWVLRGMLPDGVLTTIDPDPARQRAAKAVFADEQVAGSRTRVITRPPLDVLPRLTDGAYDVVLVAVDALSLAPHVEAAIGLLRPGGVLGVVDAALAGRATDAEGHGETAAAVRAVALAVRADDRLVPAMVPTGDGLLLAVRR